MSVDLFDPLVCESSPILFPHQSHYSAKMKGGYREAYNATIRSKYFYAMLIYLAYAAAMVMNNDIGSQDRENKVYVIFAVVHVIDAYLFLRAWEDKTYVDVETWPEYLNIAGSGLYLWSSTLYDTLYVISDNGNIALSGNYYACRQIELIASTLEVFAAAGWIYVWYKGLTEQCGTDLRSIPGRGFTIYDPDLHANWTLIAGALSYFVYNIDLSRNPRRYDTSNIYEIADILYFLNAIAYMAATLRDLGWFWMAPYLCTSFEVTSEEKWPLSPQCLVSDNVNIDDIIGSTSGPHSFSC